MSGLYLSSSMCCNKPQRSICVLFVRARHYPPPHKHRFFMCFSSFFISKYSASRFTQVYIITYSTLPDCFKMTPIGTVCLTMATVYTLPKCKKPRSPARAPSTDPDEYDRHPTVSFNEEWEENTAVEGNWGQHTDDFGPGFCVRWRRAHCVTLWRGGFVA